MVQGTFEMSPGRPSRDPNVNVTEEPMHASSVEEVMVAGGKASVPSFARTVVTNASPTTRVNRQNNGIHAGRGALKRLQVNREFIQVRNVQSSKLRRTDDAQGLSYGELPTSRGEMGVLHNRTLFK
jgi:hypothetical protein